MPDTCTFHIFTCVACRRQWTVHINNPDETTQCYFAGLCFDCINAGEIKQHEIENALRNLVRRIPAHSEGVSSTT